MHVFYNSWNKLFNPRSVPETVKHEGPGYASLKDPKLTNRVVNVR